VTTAPPLCGKTDDDADDDGDGEWTFWLGDCSTVQKIKLLLIGQSSDSSIHW
jgi:hypothetical protein